MSKEIFISSDYHLGHKNVIKYDNRPFDSIDEMDEAIIKNHNNVVGPNDDFYFLGDFCFNRAKTENYLQRLNGNKFFICGNHDKRDTIKLYREYGTYLGGLQRLTLNDQDLILCHYSMRVWDKSHRGTIHLYGHSHGSLEHTPWGKSMDVGIMLSDYSPYNLKTIVHLMDKRSIHQIDHHGS